ncbi:hypothetical protein FOZ63_009679, partial [Perkinsus olseni]
GEETRADMNRMMNTPRHRSYRSHHGSDSSSLIELLSTSNWSSSEKGYPISNDDDPTSEVDRVHPSPSPPRVGGKRDESNFKDYTRRSHQLSHQRSSVQLLDTTRSYHNKTTTITRDDSRQGHDEEISNTAASADAVDGSDDNEVAFDIITCYLPRGSVVSASRRVCSSSIDGGSLVAPDAELSCSRRLSPSTVVDYIYGNQPVQTLGKTLDFTDEGSLRRSTQAISTDTILHLLFNDCTGDIRSIPDLDVHYDYIAFIIVNSNAEKDASDRINQHYDQHVDASFDDSTSSSSSLPSSPIISYKTALLFYPLQYFYRSVGDHHHAINRRLADVVN